MSGLHVDKCISDVDLHSLFNASLDLYCQDVFVVDVVLIKLGLPEYIDRSTSTYGSGIRTAPEGDAGDEN